MARIYYGIRPPIVELTIGKVNIDRARFYMQQLRVLITRENFIFNFAIYSRNYDHF